MTKTTIQSSLLDKVRKNYAVMDQTKFLEMVKAGCSSNNVILSNSRDNFFLKQYNCNNSDRIDEINNVMAFFAAGDIPIVLPIQTNGDKYYFEHNGTYYSLFPYVTGRLVKHCDCSDRLFESSGKMLAKIHLLSKDGFPDITKRRDDGWRQNRFLSDAEDLIQKVERIRPKSEFDTLALELLKYKIEIVSENTMLYESLHLPNDHLVHGDYHGWNIFYDEQDGVKYVFDFEETKVAPRIFEVIRSMDFMCFSGTYEKQQFENANTYLATYHALYPINDDELRRTVKAYYLKKAHSLWIEREHYVMGNTRVDSYLNNEFFVLRYLRQHLETFIANIHL